MERDQLGGSNFIGKVSVDSQSQWAEVGGGGGEGSWGWRMD